jgi:D-3-phosphoglycerate dehydrogenase
MSRGGNPAVDRLRANGYEPIMPAPGQQPTADQLRAALQGAVGWVAGVERIDAEVLAAADALRVISRNGAGSDGIDHVAAASAGISVVTARGANARGVAELAIGVMVMCLRSVPVAMQSVASGGWERTTGREMQHRTLGIVGYGAIGREVGALARSLGMHAMAHDPFVECADGVILADLDTVLASSDVVSLHVPPTLGSPLIGARELGLFRAGAVLLNTARASLVDEGAALAALNSGILASYAVDAFEVEPPPMTELLRHPRVVATPHLGAATIESIERASNAAVDNLLAELA